MKTIKITLIVLSLLLASCASRKTVVLANGKRMTEKQFNKMIAENVERGLKKLSSEEREIILGSSLDSVNNK